MEQSKYLELLQSVEPYEIAKINFGCIINIEGESDARISIVRAFDQRGAIKEVKKNINKQCKKQYKDYYYHAYQLDKIHPNNYKNGLLIFIFITKEKDFDIPEFQNIGEG